MTNSNNASTSVSSTKVMVTILEFLKSKVARLEHIDNAKKELTDVIKAQGDAILDATKEIAKLNVQIAELKEMVAKLKMPAAPAAVESHVEEVVEAKPAKTKRTKKADAKVEAPKSAPKPAPVEECEEDSGISEEELNALFDIDVETEPMPKPEEPANVVADDEDDESDEDDDEISLEELEAMFNARSTQQRRILCQDYLRQIGRNEDARNKDKWTWEYCNGVGDELGFANFVLDCINAE